MFDQTTFFSVWYWMLTAVFWSVMSHFTFGVPYDLVYRAERRGGRYAEMCDVMIRFNLTRIRNGVESYGTPLAMLFGFFLGFVGMMGFAVDIEVAQGVFFLALPGAIISAVSASAAGRYDLDSAPAETLRRLVTRQRLFNQIVGFLAMVAAVTFFVLRHEGRIDFFTGPA